jgi:hypothetical protein
MRTHPHNKYKYHFVNFEHEWGTVTFSPFEGLEEIVFAGIILLSRISVFPISSGFLHLYGSNTI